MTYGTQTHYLRLYLPDLQPGYSADVPKSVVLTGLDIETEIHQAVRTIDVTVSFPLTDQNYDNNFFGFSRVTDNIILTQDTNVELYRGEVRLDYGS